MHPRDLSDHGAYVPGEGIDQVARDLNLDPESMLALGSNENPLGPSPQAVDAIKAGAESVSEYPKASHTDLTRDLAEYWELTPEQIWLAPGADGAIDYLTRAWLRPDDRVLVPDPGFSYYAMSTRYHHGHTDTYALSRERGFTMPVDAVLNAYDGQQIVYLTSPHNPTGAIFSLDEIRTIAAETADDTLVIVDEAYGEYAPVDSARHLLEEHTNIAVLRTFSKAYGLAGLRIGYAMVPEEWADAYARINTPFAVNELACRAAQAALTDTDHLEESVATARWGRQELRDRLNTHTWPSHGNFVLADVGDGAAVAEALKRRGVIVRDCTSFGLPACIRVTCGTRSGTKRAIETINEVLAEDKYE